MRSDWLVGVVRKVLMDMCPAGRTNKWGLYKKISIDPGLIQILMSPLLKQCSCARSFSQPIQPNIVK